MRGKVAVIGAGMIPFGELFDKSMEIMAQEAYINCVRSVDKGFDPKDIKAAWLGNADPALIGLHTVAGSWLATQTGLTDIPISRIENACPTGADTFRHAAMGIASGLYDVTLALGVEKTTEKPAAESMIDSGRSGLPGGPAWNWGATGPAMMAVFATRQMHEYGLTMENFARVAVKNHRNGTKCPYAQFRYEITIQDVLNSPMISWPLHLLDCCPQSDGAAAVILCRADLAKNYTDKPVYVLGSNVGVDNSFYWDKTSFVSLPANLRAAKGAYEMAGIKPQDVDFAELHDCFTNTELLNIEDLGFCERGRAGKLVMDGYFDHDGKFPVNASGGLKAHGHPIAATGISQLCELFWQLREEAGDRQVKIKNGIGLQHNCGGGGFGVAGINILSRTI